MVDNKTLLFVYGTLRQGQPNHCFLQQADYLGTGRTSDKFVMMGLQVSRQEPHYTPAYFEAHAGHIVGELYRVSAPELVPIDQLEGHPNVWRREKTMVVMDHGDTAPKEVSMYFYQRIVLRAHFTPDAAGLLRSEGRRGL